MPIQPYQWGMMMRSRWTVCACFILFTAPTAFATPITMQAEYESARHGLGVLTFTYDDQTPDSDASETRGFYYRYILALDFAFQDASYRLDTWEPNSITIKAQQQSAENIKLLGTLLGSDGIVYDLFLGLEIYEMWTSGTDDLTELYDAWADENAAAIIGPGGLNFLQMRTPFTSVPEPGTLAIFCIGLMGALGIRRRNCCSWSRALPMPIS